MNRRPLIPLLFGALALTGCHGSFDMSPAQVGCLPTRRVQSLHQGDQVVEERLQVELIPYPGAVMMRDPKTGRIEAVPSYDVDREEARGLQRIGKLQQPEAIAALARSPTVPVRALRFYDPRAGAIRDAGIVTGSILGAGAVAAMTAVVILIASDGFTTGAGMR